MTEIDACTLPTAERPLRQAEFDALFATARLIERVDPRRLRVALTAPLATVTDLTARETECCSFFTFTATVPTAGEVLLEIEVTPAYTGVLDGLARRYG
jgi:hypothetical protein